MTEFLETGGGQLAYDVTGQGPLVVLSPGMGDRRQAYRFLAPKLAGAGYRVATADMGQWMRYLDLAYPAKPADYDGYMAALRAKLAEPGRMAEFMKAGKSAPADAGAKLASIRCPALIIMGTQDPDFAGPGAEGEAIAAAMPAGLGTVATVDGAGHYPHAQCPDEVAALIIPFLKEHAHA